MTKIILSSLFVLTVCGCSHNINAQGLWFCSPYLAVGYGTFACVKDNVTINTSKDSSSETTKVTSSMTIAKQTTGYDVELKKSK